ncbi:hypothetical protein KMW28_23810 [Flammeovirga yaeyamensis]|uniref:DUF5689 domain-containing protein n=1 Tax=Flammeovirga yaeyamensis TaxID=367791 RepID=A0AAX1NFN1_9BACT|nr:DUF6359 domain-containing protein [Flammeovirga yaeyamensis]MBB3696597.1 uncharacterized protein YdeI (BOF family) [Flammeovirga yaeyamensis]NMF33273.1 hypothetical protein [Flammeovirga yaeyamensis]QWG05448.1 hypothetical protein KMW28_23810 [Flammeovirga yaeyamensis]
MKTQTFNKFIQLLLIGGLLSASFFGCKKDNEPDGPGTDPENPDDIEITHTIKELIDLYDDSDMMLISEEVMIKGTVISSDETGNVYKSITIQDEEGTGIQIKLNKTNLYLDYAQGQTVVVKAEDLYLGHYGGLMQLGGEYEGKLGNIEADVITKHIIAGEQGEMPQPSIIDLNNLPDNLSNLYNTWVTIKDVQFVDEDSTYADVSEGAFSATNRDLTNEEGKIIILRNSKYATWAGEKMPNESGEISAILTVFNGTNQLTLNSPEDVKFTNARFEIKDGDIADALTVAEAQKAQGQKSTWIKGYIIGTINGMSLDDFNLGLTDVTHTNFVIADSKDETDPQNGMPIQLPAGFIRDAINVKDHGDLMGTMIWLKGDLEPYFSAPGLKQTDAYSFDGEKIEEEETPDLPDFVEGKGLDILGTELTNTSIDFTTWNEARSSAFWYAANGNAYVNAYNKEAVTSWMISKEKVDFTQYSPAYLNVKEKLSFFTSTDDVKVMISADYSGTGDPKAATWSVLNSTNERAQGDLTSQFEASGEAYIAFVYNGTGDNVMSWNIYTVEVSGDEITPPEKPEAEGDGESLATAYNVTAAQENQDENDVWVKGKIVGTLSNNNLNLGLSGAVASNIAIAVNEDETLMANVVPVQLPNNSFIREQVNIVDNPDNLGKQVWIKGNTIAYFGIPGLKSPTSFSWDGLTEEEEEEIPEEEIEGAGDPISGSSLTNTSINFTTFNAISSTEIWTAANGKASINAYQKGEVESWLISENTIDFSTFTTPRLYVSEKITYSQGIETVKVLYSTDYSGDPTTASWTEFTVDGDRNNGGEQRVAFNAEGLNAVTIAFKYTADDSDYATGWDIETVEAKEKESAPVDPEYGDNIILNGGFETWTNNSPDNWSIPSETEIETSDVQEGSSALKITATARRDLKQSFDIEGGEEYKITVWYKPLSTKTNANTTFRMWSSIDDADGTEVGTVQGYFKDDEITDWEKYETTFTTDPTATTFNFEIRTYSEGTVIYDNIQVQKRTN